MNPKNGNASNTRSKSSAASGAASRRGTNNSTNVTVESEGELGIDEGAVEDERDIEPDDQVGQMGGRSSNDGNLENSELSEEDQDELMNDELEMGDGDIADGDGEGEEDRPAEELDRDAEAESSEDAGDEDEDEEEEDSSGKYSLS